MVCVLRLDIDVSSTFFLFCSNSEDYGVKDMDKDPVFDSHKSIAKLPSILQADKDQLDTFVVQTEEIPSTGAAKVLTETHPADDVGKYYPMIVSVGYFSITNKSASARIPS